MKQILIAIALLGLIAGLVVGLSVVQQDRSGPRRAVDLGAATNSFPAPIVPVSAPISVARAASGGNLDYVQQLIAAGEDLDALDEENNMAALHHAANLERIDIATALLEAGADPNIENEDVLIPLHLAAYTGNVEMAGLLIDNGSFTDTVGTSAGMTALHIAVTEGHVEMVRLLLERGALMDVEAADGALAIHIAQGEEMTEIIELFAQAIALRRPTP